MDQIDRLWQGQFILQLKLGAGAQLELVPLSLRVEEQLNLPASYQFTLRGKVHAIEQLTRLQQQPEPELQLRVGVNHAGRVVWQPWQTHVMLSLRATPLGIGRSEAEAVLQTADLLWKLTRVMKTQARKGLISQIVAEIAAENGIKSTLIETTKERGTWIQNITDFDFIVERLLPRAANRDELGNYRLYVADDTLHFHTLGYKPELRRFDFIKSGRGVDAVFIDESQQLLQACLGGLEAYTHDPLHNSVRVETSSPHQSSRHGAVMPDYQKFRHGRFTSYHSAAANLNVPESRRIAQYTYDHARSQTYSLVMTTSRTLNLKVNHLLKLEFKPDDLNRLSWSGWWTVFSARHLFESGTLTSSFVLKRGELDSQQVTAPGKPLNLSTSDLKLTQDADVVVDVLDPETLPTRQ